MKNIEVTFEKNSFGHLAIAGPVSIYTVRKVKEYLMKWLKENKSLDLSLSEVTDFDSAGFQLFEFIKREAEVLKKSINISEMSPEVSSLFRRYTVENIPKEQ